jgi:hypothetical protein
MKNWRFSMNAMASAKTVEPLSTSPPKAPEDLQSLDIPESLVEELMLRRLYTIGSSSIKSLSSSLKVSSLIIKILFERFRKQQLLIVTGMDGDDYTFTISEAGRELAVTRFDKSNYTGPAPVSLKSYQAAVRSQTANVKLNKHSLKEALSDLVLTDGLLDELGPALVSQTSLFLYGPTGNGKTSIAERISRVYEDPILIPYAVEFDGQIIVLYDPAVHQRVKTDDNGADPRWVECLRPCIAVGGELEPNMLELQFDETSKIYAAPLQMKANNGMIIIDDFGRQVISPRYLLNRWIVPLDRQVDYLALRYGVKFQIPFEMLVVFSTNIEPRELAEEAFLRRIKNKVYVGAVDDQVFSKIFKRIVAEKNLHCKADSAEILRRLCIDFGGNELRACYPIDILNIIISICKYDERPVEINSANLERATTLYFTKTMTMQ